VRSVFKDEKKGEPVFQHVDVIVIVLDVENLHTPLAICRLTHLPISRLSCRNISSRSLLWIMRSTPPLRRSNGPGMTIFSPDGKYGYVCSSFSPETVVIATAGHKVVGHVTQEIPFCPNIAATPDGKQVWLTLKDVGKTMVFNARPPFDVVKVIDRHAAATARTRRRGDRIGEGASEAGAISRCKSGPGKA
jgi:hypothetical protein